MSLQYYTALSHLEWAFKKKLLHEVCFHIVQWQGAAAKSKQKFKEKSDAFLFFAIIYLFDKVYEIAPMINLILFEFASCFKTDVRKISQSKEEINRFICFINVDTYTQFHDKLNYKKLKKV